MAPIVPNSLTICAEVGLDDLEFALHHRDELRKIQRDVLPGRVLASRGTGPGMRRGWSGMTLTI
jgi:hypothetical protein